MNAFSRPYIYCGECLRRVSHESGGRCSKCGKKAVIGLFEKILRDDSFSGKQKTELRFCALINAAALVFEIAFCIVAVDISGDIIQRAESDIDITLSVESERLSEIDINETLGTPPPYSDFCFYMDQDNKQGMDEMWRSSGLTMEQISYWRSVYSQQYIF